MPLKRFIPLALAILSLLIEITLAWRTFGTNDILTWMTSADLIAKGQRIELYQSLMDVEFNGAPYFKGLFNHPPFTIYLLQAIHWAAELSGVPFETVFRILMSLAGFASFFVVRALMPDNVIGLSLYAVSPVMILVAGFHGNTDPLMMLLILTAVWCVEKKSSAIWCGAALGMAMNIKVVPTILLPSLLLYLRGWKARVLCITAVIVVWLIPSASLLAADWKFVIGRTFGYSSFPGYWGFSYLWVGMPGFGLLLRFGKYALLGGILALSVLMNLKEERPPLFVQWGAILFTFLFFATGFGVQYLVWVTPWVIAYPAALIVICYLLQGLFLCVVYDFWSGGLPWYFADGIEHGPWRGWRNVPQLLAWLSVGLAMSMALVRVLPFQRREADDENLDEN